jgi:OmpA-OmpF porin, OOP family
MTWSKRAALSAALVLFASGPASGQIAGRPFEISAGGGLFAFDTRAFIEDAPVLGATLGWRATPWVTLEGVGLWSSTETKLPAGGDHTFGYLGADVRWNLRPAENRAVPYLITGVGYVMSDSDARDPDELRNTGGSLGLGFLYNVVNPRTYLRLQVRDVFAFDRTPELANHVAVTAALQFAFGGKPKDIDLDGVRDWLDACPQTPIGARVDARGCPTDADRDSVFDGIDKCENTPAGCRVDRTGCPLDADGDGVCDGLDQCADTPKGATVNAVGCPGDADRDSVLDGIDQCPGTPAGATVNAQGCPSDADGDGVFDGVDQCANTPRGTPVDARGCPTPEGEREVELVETGMIRLQNVNFASGDAEVAPESRPVLDAVGPVLVRYPTLRIEIGGHTDAEGSDAANRRLSEARARAVRAYLTNAFTGIQPDRLTVRGYGESRPIASNATDAGRAANRRVEFVVLNKGELIRVIRERTTAPQQAPRDTTGSGD